MFAITWDKCLWLNARWGTNNMGNDKFPLLWHCQIIWETLRAWDDQDGIIFYWLHGIHVDANLQFSPLSQVFLLHCWSFCSFGMACIYLRHWSLWICSHSIWSHSVRLQQQRERLGLSRETAFWMISSSNLVLAYFPFPSPFFFFSFKLLVP